MKNEEVEEIEQMLPVVEDSVSPVDSLEAPASVPVVKEKKPRSQAQIDAFIKVRAKRDQNRLARLKTRDEETVVHNAKIEEKIVKKAVAIRKKQIVREAVLDDISDDDIPVEIVKKIIKKYPKKAVAPAPVKSAPAPVKQPIVFV